MIKRFNQDVALGITAIALGLFITLFWAPIDSDTGLAEKIRGRWSIGDALAPTVAGVAIALSGLWLAISSLLKSATTPGFGLSNLRYLAILACILAASLLVMRYAGPVITGLTGEEYRLLRDTVPYKYIGFVIGGGGMIFALISLIEGTLSAKRLALALTIAFSLALVYDLPFEDLLLPPNGDV